MPIVCPDPATLTAWRNAMAAVGAGLLLAALLLIALMVRARPAGWLPWLASGLSAALAIGVSIASLDLFKRLTGAFAQVASWFPDYPAGCTPAAAHWSPRYIDNIERFAQQAVEPLEHAARIDLAVAALALVTLVACGLAWGRKRRVAAIQYVG